MAQVPIYNQQTVADKHIAHGYQDININGDMIGENIIRANYLLGKAGERLSDKINVQLDEYNKTKVVDLTNKFDVYSNQALYDKENGYFNKTGQNAAGQSANVLQGFDDYASQLVEESGLSGRYKEMAINSLASKRNDVYKAVTKHDFDQTKIWQNSVYTEKENNILNQAILDRNDDTRLAAGLKQGYNAITLQAQLQGWDSDITNLKKAEFTSRYHEGVINALLSDGSLRAKGYYNVHKNEILPDKHNTILNAVNNNEIRYEARGIVEGLIAKGYSPDKAYQEIDKISNFDLQAAVRSQYEGKMRERDRIQALHDQQKSEASWNKVIETLQSNPDLAYQAIDVSQSPEVIKAQMSYIEQMRKFGEIKTGHQVYLDLQDKMTYDADGFKNTDLNLYRPYLSESDFKNFKENQSKIGSMEYTILQEDNKMIDNALKTIGGHSKTEKVIYSEAQALVTEFEKRHGRKINDSELQGIIDSLGYKGENGVAVYKNIEKGMAEQVGFIKTITNDFAYFEKIHKRQPDAKERAQIIDQRTSNVLMQQNSETVNSLQTKINNTTAKPHETKELTYYADTYLPQLERQLGAKLTVVENGRYNPRAKGYSSYHNVNGVSHAIDVSMSEHSNITKDKFFASELKNPQVSKIGTSDPYILKKYGNNPKVVNETEFDKKHGTNHVNHAHITLKTNSGNQTTQTVYKVGNYTVRVKG